MTDQSPLRPPAPDGVRRSLILAGGGMRVSYQAGVIRALAEAGLGFDHVDGTSGGTMNAAMLLSGLDAVQMCERWRTLDPKQFVSFMPPRAYLDVPDLPALGDARGLIAGVFPHLGISIPAIRAASGVLGTFNVCNFTRKVNRVVPHQEMDLDFLVAGVSLPIFMPAVAKDGELYMDSVWIRDANPLEAIQRGADELWIVWCIGNSPTYRNGIFNQYVHMIELSANGRLIEDFEQIRAWNASIAAGEAIHGHRRPIRVHLIKPLHPLPLDPDYYLGRIDAATLIAKGYADAIRYLSNLPPDGILLQPEATAMTDAKPGLTFRETMSGGFSLSATDPLTGESSGAKTPMSMHASVEIDDVERFIKDPTHLGSLSGTIDYSPMASGIPS